MMLAWCGEELSDHLREVACLAERMAVILRLDDQDQEDVFLAGLLHDVGKADKGAQQRVSKCEGSPGHELLSALVSNNLLSEVLPPERRFKIVLAIWRHHQAMRSLDGSLEDIKGWFKGELQDREELRKILSERCLGIKDIWWPRSRKEIESSLRQMQGEFKDLYTMEGLVLKARLLSGILMIADTYVAKVRRKGEISEFGREVITFINSSLNSELCKCLSNL